MITTMPQEFRLLAACCTWPHIAECTSAIITAGGGVDWERFLRLAKYHRVTALAASGLKAAGISPPADTLQQLTASANASVRQSLAVAAETVRLQQAFDKAAVPAVFLKGATLAIRAYGTLAVKSSRDVDLLTLPAHVEAALRLMNKLGYTLNPPFDRMDKTQFRHFVRFGRELPLQSAKSNLTVEIKWRPTYNRLLLSGVSATSRWQAVAISKTASARTFNDADLFSYLCVHGAVHRWSRLKWLADIHALLAAASPEDISSWYRSAKEIGAGICAAQALLLCTIVFDMPLPGDLETAVSGWQPKYLVVKALKTMSAPAQDDLVADRCYGGGSARLYSFLLGTGLRFHLEQFNQASVQPIDVIVFRLPEKLHWLYPLLRIPFFALRNGFGFHA